MPPRLISLENFDPGDIRCVINSPRSLEACRSLGIEPSELIRMPLPEEDEKLKPEFKDRLKAHLEQRRSKKLHIALERRQEIIHGSVLSPNRNATASQQIRDDEEPGFLKAERKRVQKAEERQTREMANILLCE